MVDRIFRRNAFVLEPVIGVRQVAQIGIGKGHMVQPGVAVDMLFGAREAEHGDPVMLAVIGDEAEMVGLEHRFGFEHRLVPIEHGFHLLRQRLQNYVRKFGGSHFAPRFRRLR